MSFDRLHPNDPRIWVNFKYRIAWRRPLIYRVSPKMEAIE